MSKIYVKHTIIIYSQHFTDDGEEFVMPSFDLEDVAREANRGDMICTQHETVFVNRYVAASETGEFFGAVIDEDPDYDDSIGEEETDGYQAYEDCYYHDLRTCAGEIWVCQTCLTTYCEAHWHQTDKGINVECVVCERERRGNNL